MKITTQNLTEKTVQVELEINSSYNKNPAERKIFGNSYVIKEYEKKHPDEKVSKVLTGNQLDNFTKTGILTGIWVLELARPEKIEKEAPIAAKKRTRKQIIPTK